MNTDLKNYLQSIELSYLFAKSCPHGVQVRGKWDLFEPTRFVYAFFSFNMIYSVDWSSSLKRKKVWYLNDKEHKKIYSLVKFISDHDSFNISNVLEEFDKSRSLYHIVSKMTHDYKSEKMSFSDTGNTIAADFILAAKKYSNGQSLSFLDHFELLQMAYVVRNNLFHGEKKAYEMRDNGHLDRLQSYGNIVLATNELFFRILSDHYDYRRMEEMDLLDNLHR